MNRLLLLLSLLFLATSLYAQDYFLHTNPSGEYGQGIMSGSYFRYDTIRISGAGYVEFSAYVSASDIDGYSQVMIYSSDMQTQYYSINVTSNQPEITIDEQHYYYVPNNCLTITSMVGNSTASVSYRQYNQPSLVTHTYDNAGNRVGREIVYLQSYCKREVTMNKKWQIRMYQKQQIRMSIFSI